MEELLESTIPFYQTLNQEKRLEFNKRVQKFIASKRFTPINCVLTDQDKVLIAAGAMIPIFNFPEYYYPELSEILIYPGAFNKDYE